MATEIEISLLDTRYELFRMKDSKREGALLSNIAQRGIEEPLEGFQVEPHRILLNGFKRYRCARKLQIATVPFVCLSHDEVHGIVKFLRSSNNRTSLSILEQARFVDELYKVHQMSVAEIATDLTRSKTWVNMRLGLIAEMSPAVCKELFAGRFPAYSYMVTLRPFRCLKGVSAEQLDQFVLAVSGHKLSIREIEQLAHGFFRGPESFRREVLKGNLALPLQQINQTAPDPGSCSEFERILLKDLELTQKYMQRIMGKSHDPRIKSQAFHAQSHLLTAGILSRCAAFTQSMNALHDRNRQA
jgi:hypothetical protein